MFACERCGHRMDIEETSNKPVPGQCHRERQCPKCDFVCRTTEVSDVAYKEAVHKAALELAKVRVADHLEILGLSSTGDKKQHS
jgi:hypothetical protein